MVIAAPVVTRADPALLSPYGGEIVRFYGQHFASQGLVITIDGQLCGGVQFHSVTEISCTSPPGVGQRKAVQALVSSPSGQVRGLPAEVLSYSSPIIYSLGLKWAVPGLTVEVDGRYFVDSKKSSIPMLCMAWNSQVPRTERGVQRVTEIAEYVSDTLLKCPISGSVEVDAGLTIWVSNDGGKAWSSGMYLTKPFHYYNGQSKPRDGHAGSAQSAPASIQIGLLVPRSDPLAHEVEAAFQTAIDSINRDGEMLPFTKLVGAVGDTRGTREGGISAAKNLTNDTALPNLVGLIGAYWSTVSVNVSQAVATPNKLPMVSYGSMNSKLSRPKDHPYFVRNIVSDKGQAGRVVQLLKTLNFKHIGIVTDSTLYATTFASKVEELWQDEDVGGTVVKKVQFDDPLESGDLIPPEEAQEPTKTNAEDAIYELRRAGARIIVMEGTQVSAVASMIQALHRLDFIRPGYGIVGDYTTFEYARRLSAAGMSPFQKPSVSWLDGIFGVSLSSVTQVPGLLNNVSGAATLLAHDAVYLLADAVAQQINEKDGGKDYLDPGKPGHATAREQTMAYLRNKQRKFASRYLTTGPHQMMGRAFNDRDPDNMKFQVLNIHVGSSSSRAPLKVQTVGEISETAGMIIDGTSGFHFSGGGAYPENTPFSYNPNNLPATLTIAYVVNNGESVDLAWLNQAVADVNSNPRVLPFTTLNLVTRTETAGTTYLAECRSLIAEGERGGGGDVIAAFIHGWSGGAETFHDQIGVPSAIPSVGVWSTKNELSNSTRFPYFARVCKSDSYNVNALLTVMAQTQWNRFVIIQLDPDFDWESGYVEALWQAADQMEMKVGYMSFASVPADSPNRTSFLHNESKRILQKASLEGQTIFVIPWVKIEHVKALYGAAKEMDMLRGKQFLFPDIQDLINFEDFTASQSNLGLLQNIDGTIGLDPTGVDLGSAQAKASAAAWVNQGHPVTSFYQRSGVPARAYDAILLLADSAHRCLLDGNDVLNGTHLMSYIRTNKFNGITGPLDIEEDSNDRQRERYQIVNVQSSNAVKAAFASNAKRRLSQGTSPSDAFVKAGTITGNKIDVQVCPQNNLQVKLGNECQYDSERVTFDVYPDVKDGTVISWRRPATRADTHPPDDMLVGFQISVRNGLQELLSWTSLQETMQTADGKLVVEPLIFDVIPDRTHEYKFIIQSTSGDPKTGLVPGHNYYFDIFPIYGIKARAHGMQGLPFDDGSGLSSRDYCKPPSLVHAKQGKNTNFKQWEDKADTICGISSDKFWQYGEPPSTGIPKSWNDQDWVNAFVKWDRQVPCPEGAECYGKAWSDIITKPGYWRTSNISVVPKFKKCLLGDKTCAGGLGVRPISKKDCPVYKENPSDEDKLLIQASTCFCYPDPYTGTTGDMCLETNPMPCAEGSTGFRCGACIANETHEYQQESPNSECTLCQFKQSESWGILVGIICGVVLLAVVALVVISKFATVHVLEKELTAVLTKIDTQYGVAGIKQVFKSFDNDGNGTLDAAEFQAALKQLGLGRDSKVPITDKDYKRVIKKIDKNGDGIEAEEFVTFIRNVKGSKKTKRANLIKRLLSWWSSARTKTIKVVVIGYMQVIGTLKANFPKASSVKPSATCVVPITAVGVEATIAGKASQTEFVAEGTEVVFRCAENFAAGMYDGTAWVGAASQTYMCDPTGSLNGTVSLRCTPCAPQVAGNGMPGGLNVTNATAYPCPPIEEHDLLAGLGISAGWLSEALRHINIFMDDISRILGMLNVTAMGFFRCMFGPRFYAQLILNTAVPMAIIVLIWALPKIFRGIVRCPLCHKCCKPKHLYKAKIQVDAMAPAALSMDFTLVFLLYPMMCTTIIRSFVCERFDLSEDGLVYQRWLKDDPLIMCSASYDPLPAGYFPIAMFAGVMVCVTIIGIPVFIVYLVYPFRYPINKLYYANEEGEIAPCETADKAVGVVYRRYKPAFWYFESAEMVRKVILAAVIGAIPPEVIGTETAAICWCILFCSIIVWFYSTARPFVDEEGNSLQTICHVVLILRYASLVLNAFVQNLPPLEINLHWNTFTTFYQPVTDSVTLIPYVMAVFYACKVEYFVDAILACLGRCCGKCSGKLAQACCATRREEEYLKAKKALSRLGKINHDSLVKFKINLARQKELERLNGEALRTLSVVWKRSRKIKLKDSRIALQGAITKFSNIIHNSILDSQKGACKRRLFAVPLLPGCLDRLPRTSTIIYL